MALLPRRPNEILRDRDSPTHATLSILPDLPAANRFGKHMNVRASRPHPYGLTLAFSLYGLSQLIR